MIFMLYQLPTQTPPTPLSPPKRGFSLLEKENAPEISSGAFHLESWTRRPLRISSYVLSPAVNLLSRRLHSPIRRGILPVA